MKYSYIFLLGIILNHLAAQSVDSVVIKQVDSLIKVSQDLTGKGDYEKAFEVNAIAEQLVLDKLGKETAAYGNTCFNHGRILHFKKDYHEAANWYIESKVVREKVLGKVNLDYAQSLYSLAILSLDLVKYDEAIRLYLEVIRIREKVLGKDHPEYARGLNNLAIVYRKQGKYQKALSLYLEANSIFGKALGKEHPDYTGSLNNLANLHLTMGNYEQSESMMAESKTIREKIQGKDHPDYAASLYSIARLYEIIGKYEQAEPLFIEALTIYKKSLGKENYYASTLNSLAHLYLQLGNYQKAEPLLLESKSIVENMLGKDHPDYATSLSLLASFYLHFGNYEKAESFIIAAKDIREKAFGKENSDFINSMNQLAGFYYAIDNYEKAEMVYLEVNQLVDKVFGIEHPDYNENLNDLATVYKEMGNYEKAEILFIKTNAYYKKQFGKDHLSYAISLTNLAILYTTVGKFKEAEPLAVEAKKILEKNLGKSHYLFIENLTNHALVYVGSGNYLKAELILEEVSSLEKNLVTRSIHHMSEVELNQYLQTFEDARDFIFSLNLKSKVNTSIAGICFDNILFYKGFVLNACNQSKKLIYSNSLATEKYILLKSYSRRLSKEYSSPISERKGVLELEEKSNSLEKEITRMVSGYSESIKQVSWQQVQQKLKSNEAAIEFVYYRELNKKSIDSLTSPFQEGIVYAALLIRPGIDQPQFIPLFEEKSLDSLLNSKSERKSDYVNNLYNLADRGAVAVETPQKSLYEILWKPLEKELTNVNTIYFSPSGLLHRINLDAIPISETETLADRYNLIELNSTRQLVIPTQIKKCKQRCCFVWRYTI
ncbi:MAG: tetratricopeptide repeat protein [Saprospiraceae bacterium]|nr:tetratricopeptide repeat protein [Candidatus Vicinibacter affinis]